jgi:tripartite-type tricarboxylate transporter receptor subunit TctC
MKIPQRKFLQFAVAIVAVHAFSQVATAQPYPTRPITIVVGFAPGGPTDTTAGILAQRMTPLLGAQVIIEPHRQNLWVDCRRASSNHRC